MRVCEPTLRGLGLQQEHAHRRHNLETKVPLRVGRMCRLRK